MDPSLIIATIPEVAGRIHPREEDEEAAGATGTTEEIITPSGNTQQLYVDHRVMMEDPDGSSSSGFSVFLNQKQQQQRDIEAAPVPISPKRAVTPASSYIDSHGRLHKIADVDASLVPSTTASSPTNKYRSDRKPNNKGSSYDMTDIMDSSIEEDSYAPIADRLPQRAQSDFYDDEEDDEDEAYLWKEPPISISTYKGPPRGTNVWKYRPWKLVFLISLSLVFCSFLIALAGSIAKRRQAKSGPDTAENVAWTDFGEVPTTAPVPTGSAPFGSPTSQQPPTASGPVASLVDSNPSYQKTIEPSVCKDMTGQFFVDTTWGRRTCKFLKTNHPEWDDLCREAGVGVEKCPTSCGLCNGNPEIVSGHGDNGGNTPLEPTESWEDLGAPSAAPIPVSDVCTDDPDASLEINKKYSDVNCDFLQFDKGTRKRICNDLAAARRFCHRTCQICERTCSENPDDLVYVGEEWQWQSCAWLATKEGHRNRMCRDDMPGFFQCPVTCGRCIALVKEDDIDDEEQDDSRQGQNKTNDMH